MSKKRARQEPAPSDEQVSDGSAQPAGAVAAPPRESRARGNGATHVPMLLQQYRDRAMNDLMKEFDYANVMEVPRVAKVVVNIGIGEAKDNPRALEAAVSDVRDVTGQQPQIVKARKSVAAFKLRAGMPVGIKATLRGPRMWYFLEKLINVALPRIRDFRGVNPRSFDGHGNYSLGLSEQSVFPEVDPDKVTFVQGMDVTFVTSTNNDDEARELLRGFGMPFRES